MWAQRWAPGHPLRRVGFPYCFPCCIFDNFDYLVVWNQIFESCQTAFGIDGLGIVHPEGSTRVNSIIVYFAKLTDTMGIDVLMVGEARGQEKKF